MTPFEFLTVFFSFAYALAFSHVLLAAAEMIRHRRVLLFSWPHALWMANAVMLLFSNWISLYDFRAMEVMSLGTILTLFVFVTTLYFTCALVTPDFDAGDGYDMRAFHHKQSRAYIGAILALDVVSFLSNLQAGRSGISDWGSENAIVLAMTPLALLPLLSRNKVVQIACPVILLAEQFAFLTIYYPSLSLTGPH
jgi:hypothetical protein